MTSNKSRLRKMAHDISQHLTESEILTADEAIYEKLIAHINMSEAKIVFCYVSYGAEPDTHRVLEYLFDVGAKVAVPLCDTEKRTMTAHYIATQNDLQKGNYGIYEPKSDALMAEPSEFDLVIMPCVAVDKAGHRLGHGMGYYDKYLQDISCTTICLCRKKLIFEDVCAEKHDIPPDIIITD